MKNSFLLIYVICLTFKCHAQSSEIYTQKYNGTYMQIVHNDETGTEDTFVVKLYKNQTFSFYKKGVEDRGQQMVGRWRVNGNMLTLINRYPYEKFLAVKVLQVKDGCNNYFPDIVDNKGKIATSFFMNAKHYTYTKGETVTYVELDSLRDSVRICSNIGNHCSRTFSIPYRDCYRLVIDMDVDDPNIYNGAISKMYFRKEKSRLVLIKTEASGPTPD